MDFNNTQVSFLQTQRELPLGAVDSIATVAHRHRQSQSPVSPVEVADLTEPIELVGTVHPPPDRVDVLIPTKPDHWESVKEVIEELYIHKNVRLKDVIEIMLVLYKFRAT